MSLTDMEPAVAGLRTSDLFIAGAWTAADDQRYVETTNALTGQPIARVAAASAADARAAVDAAAVALPEWSSLPPARRREVLQRAAALLGERAEELAALMGREMGATRPWCLFNVHVAQGMLTEAAAQAYSTVGQVIPSDVPGLTALGLRQPVGVVVGIAPWNAPLILGVRAVAMPLVYGNTVVLKASEQTPCTQAAIVELLHEAGASAGAVNLISNAPADAPQIVEALVAHPDVARVNFTGSTRVGRIIAELAGRHLKRVVLELGGKHDEPQMPFGGVGASGWGRFGSSAALEEFTELRWVTIQSGERHYPI
ncbi:MAG: aldehyde dehydrogenase family protein [Trebonia sp.]